MHVFLSGIGGAGIGPLARMALQLGHTVSGSDMSESPYLDELRKLGITIHPGQDGSQIAAIHTKHQIDWFVYASAIAMKDPDGPELRFAREHGIKSTKRDEFLNYLITQSDMKLLAIAGTHGKTTTTAMSIWLMRELGMKLSWSVGGKLPFADMGHAQHDAEWFIYECDEFDRNFLSFYPNMSLISGLAYDHHEIYPTFDDYNQAFRTFISQSTQTIMYTDSASQLYANQDIPASVHVITPDTGSLVLAGEVNRLDAFLAMSAVSKITQKDIDSLTEIMNRFPGVSRRFEYIIPGLVTDYAHTPEKIKGCLQLAKEVSDDIVVIYEPLTNRRQHYIKEQYAQLFEGISRLYWVPAFQAREHPGYANFHPKELIAYMNNAEIAEPAALDNALRAKIESHLKNGQLVVALSGGGVGSLDNWLRKEFKNAH